ncbi:MAG: DUF924 family protein [Pseudomonadota bacterium]
MNPDDLLDFWLSERARPLWFEKNAAFDEEIRRRFGGWIEAGAEGRLAAWEHMPDSALALVVLLDQFPRNIFRGSPRAFMQDAAARAVADRAIQRGHDRAVALAHRFFFYLPYEHSESLEEQRRSVALFRRWVEAHEGPARAQAEDQFRYVLRHQEIIERFGRFPHRNAILGRASSPEELAFLAEPMSSF